jgi:hypothetical protein
LPLLASPCLSHTTTFYDAMGHQTSRAVPSGNETIVYDAMGRRACS